MCSVSKELEACDVRFARTQVRRNRLCSIYLLEIWNCGRPLLNSKKKKENSSKPRRRCVTVLMRWSVSHLFTRLTNLSHNYTTGPSGGWEVISEEREDIAYVWDRMFFIIRHLSSEKTHQIMKPFPQVTVSDWHHVITLWSASEHKIFHNMPHFFSDLKLTRIRVMNM